MQDAVHASEVWIWHIKDEVFNGYSMHLYISILLKIIQFVRLNQTSLKWMNYCFLLTSYHRSMHHLFYFKSFLAVFGQINKNHHGDMHVKVKLLSTKRPPNKKQNDTNADASKHSLEYLNFQIAHHDLNSFGWIWNNLK